MTVGMISIYVHFLLESCFYYCFRVAECFLSLFSYTIILNLLFQGALHWLGDEELHMVKGFPWAVGVDSLTTGIIMWSEPFMLRDAKGNNVSGLKRLW